MPDPAAPAASATDELVAKLAAEIRSATPSMPAAPPQTREAIIARLDKAGEGGGGKFAEEFANSVLVPAQMQNVRHAAQINRRITEKDPALGPLYGRYRKQVEARAAELGGDAYIAEKGLDGIVRSVAGEDPAYIDEIAERRATERFAAKEAEAKAAAAAAAAAAPAVSPVPSRPPVETVHSGPVSSPSTPAPSEEEEIRRIEVTDEDAALAKTIFNMTPTDIRRQRHEITKIQRKYGRIGIQTLGGTPICSLSDCKTSNGSPYPSESD